MDALRDLDALIEKGALLHRLGKTEEAIAHFDAARRIAPDHELVLSNLAVALADSGSDMRRSLRSERFCSSIRKMSTFGISCGV